jgi:hypothetical protein
MLTKNVVIVTHDNDWHQCTKLLESIDFWLENLNVILIDNNPHPGNVRFVMLNNHLKIVPWSDLIPRRVMSTETYDNGWVCQQLLKLAACKFFTNDRYVILDSKNIILRDLTQWPRDLMPIMPRSETLYDFYTCTQDLFGLKNRKIINPQAPYEFDCNRVKELLAFWPSWDEFEEWFCSFQRPSELILYDLWLQRLHMSEHDSTPRELELLTVYNWAQWQTYQKNTKVNFYRVASIDSSVWNNPQFDSLCRQPLKWAR